uniref:Small ribosomal subunit protein eS7 n=1 Tax=Glossina palpalis gambiensis TaxID=67801 RepID=A0A1B0ALL9_9MUSC
MDVRNPPLKFYWSLKVTLILNCITGDLEHTKFNLETRRLIIIYVSIPMHKILNSTETKIRNPLKQKCPRSHVLARAVYDAILEDFLFTAHILRKRVRVQLDSYPIPTQYHETHLPQFIRN